MTPDDRSPEDPAPDWPPESTPDRSAGRRARVPQSLSKPKSMDELRETYREQMLANIGGWSGALITAIPTAVFVIVNVVTSLRPAIGAAVGSALLLAAYRFVRKQSVQQALSGLLGVLIAAIIAARTGEARGYFLLGIITSFVYAVPFAVSVVVRRPLVGLAWEFLDPTPGVPYSARNEQGAAPWFRRRPLLLAYTWATLAATLVFLLRGVVQLILYRRDATGWLAAARLVMGYPLFVAAIGFAFLVIARARRSVVADEASADQGLAGPTEEDQSG